MATADLLILIIKGLVADDEDQASVSSTSPMEALAAVTFACGFGPSVYRWAAATQGRSGDEEG